MSGGASSDDSHDQSAGAEFFGGKTSDKNDTRIFYGKELFEISVCNSALCSKPMAPRQDGCKRTGTTIGSASEIEDCY